ncbi:MAG: phosphoribosylaminoimidazolesuccinocarboxamide synthase, partial [Candidatus Omnitrophota bacterium]
MKKEVLLSTDLEGLKLHKRGKVRDVYDLGDKLLIVSTDRISCFDVVLPCGIPHKGRVLTQLSCFWFDFIKDII